MRRSWLALALVGVLVLAGCSGFGGGGTPTPEPTDDPPPPHPQGWNATGIANATLAIQGADATVSGADFTERQVVVVPSPGEFNASYVVQVVVTEFDFDERRGLYRQEVYGVSESTATSVVESGADAVGDRSPDRVQRSYVNRTGGAGYLDDGNGEPRTMPIVGNFSSTVDRQLPLQFGIAVELARSGRLSQTNATDAGFEYDLEGVSAFEWEDGSGRVVLTPDGLVSEMRVSGSIPDGRVGYAYSVQRGDVQVEHPEWAS